MENTPENFFTTKKIVIALLSVVLVAGAGAGYYLYSRPTQSTKPVSRENPLTGLLTNNQDFATAERLRHTNNPTTSIPYYQKALSQTTNIDEQGQILYLLSIVQDRTSTIGTAIQQLKDISTNPAYTNLQRAYAAQQVGELFYRNTNTKDITSIVFSGQPYADFYKEADVQLALRRLYEYAASLYPLAVAELRAARWYSSDLVRLSKEKTLTAAEKDAWDADLSFVQDALTKADADIKRTLKYENASELIPSSLIRKAQVLGDLKMAGIPAEDPEPAFLMAIQTGLASGNDLSPRFSYAGYLTRAYGASRAADIKANLSVIYSDLVKNVGFKIFFENERRNVTGQKAIVAQMASIDPDFKKALLSLGWTDADFK